MQKVHVRQKIVNQLGDKPRQIEALQQINTTELERLARTYERGMSLNEFERSAVLRAIAAELVERTAEAKELRKGDR